MFAEVRTRPRPAETHFDVPSEQPEAAYGSEGLGDHSRQPQLACESSGAVGGFTGECERDPDWSRPQLMEGVDLGSSDPLLLAPQARGRWDRCMAPRSERPPLVRTAVAADNSAAFAHKPSSCAMVLDQPA